MKSFIRECVDEILKTPGDDYSGKMLVFPTRRACMYFKKEFSNAIDKPAWSPRVISINEFMEEYTGYTIPDKLTLLFELFEVYKMYFENEPFDAFYPWGQMLLNDFDEIDRSMVNAKYLFSHIVDIKKMEGEFAIEEEDLIAVQKFWNEIAGENKDLSIIKKEFMKIWMALNPMYEEFKKRLLAKNSAYEGMAFLTIAQRKETIAFGFQQYIFAGFYAPSRSEQAIIVYLKKMGKALVWADADHYYTDNKAHEAGTFFRKKGMWDEPLTFQSKHFENTPKNIEVSGIPLQYGRAKAIGNTLQKLLNSQEKMIEKTAVVLPDENMLFPILYAVPPEIEHINVTMGYPLRNTPLFHLVSSLFQLLKNARTENKNTSLFEQKTTYYYKDVIRIILHPYVMQTEPLKCRALLNKMNDEGMIRVSSDFLLQKNQVRIFSFIFSPASIDDIAFYFMDVIKQLSSIGITEKKLHLSTLEKEYFFHFYTLTKRLLDLLTSANYKADIQLYKNLLLEIIQSSHIPFIGEAVNGLQIMGFLETRVLDFENILMPSLNEGLLPPASNKHSYIPYSLRKAYGLATFEDHDAIYSYHFYRLLQRAKNIYLYYDTEIKSLSGGEKSRYLLQLKHELIKKMPHIKYTEKTQVSHIPHYSEHVIEIAKDEDIMNTLRKYFYREKGEGSNSYSSSFSATALNTYINCSLQFYFKYIAGLKELEETEEEIDAKTFGSIFHKAIELLYAKREEITKDFLDAEIQNINRYVELAFHEIIKGHDHESGKNLLVKSVITELIKRMFTNELKDAPFKVVEMEKNMKIPFRFDDNKDPVLIQGYIDRIDEKNGIYRILDYKTGKVKINDVEISDFFEDPENKISLQTYLYAWLYKQEDQSRKIQLGIYPVRKPADGILYFEEGNPIAEDHFTEFETHLKTLFKKLFNTTVPFKQTEDKERCMYCPYKMYCGIS